MQHRKKLIIMRNTVLIMLISTFQVLATGSYAQTKTISLSMHDASIREVLYAIQNQSEFYFLYNSELIDVNKKVNIVTEKEKVDEILTLLFDKNEVDFLIKDRYIVLTPVGGNEELLSGQQQRIISGKVTDDSGSAMPGVTVIIKGTTQGTITDTNGNYSMTLYPESKVLQFSFVGMKTQEIPIDNNTTINVKMVVDAIGIEEVVAIGYGTLRKSDITGAVTSIRGQALISESASNPAQVLQGRAPGVQVVGNGDPGTSPTVRIRGIGTTNNSEPLYVVDGLMVNDINFLNNNDVESIEILKDASATAIYGSRGANGVILITTKRGNSNSPIFSVDIQEGIERPHAFSMVDAWEYATLINEGLTNAGGQKAYDVNNITKSTDWIDEIWNSASHRNYNVSFSQGTERNNYYIGVGMFQQNGIIDKSGYERYSIRINNTYALNSNITLGHNFVGSWETKNNRPREAFDDIYRIPPTVPVRDEEGNFADTKIGSTSNIAGAIHYFHNFTNTQSLVGNAFLNIRFLEHFQFRSSIGIDLRYGETTNFNPIFFISNTQRREQNSINKTWAKNNNWLWENTISYIQTFNDAHRINAVVGYTAQENNFENIGGGRNELFAEDRSLWYFNAGSPQGIRNFNSANSSGIISYLGRINYTFKDRYLITGTYRIDGSSRFASNNRWGQFPSLAIGWRISEEEFLKNLDWLSDLKFRTSWGQIGNERIGDYRYFATAATGNAYAGIWNNTIDPGVTVTTLANRKVSWETAEQFDIGLEFSLLKNKINAEIDWYRKTTNDMLVIVGLPASAGFNATEGNVGSVRNEGFEINLNYIGGRNNWSYSIGLNAATINNKVISLGTEKELIGGNIGPGGNVTRTMVGQPIGFFYGYKSLGPFDTQDEIDNAPSQTNVKPGDLRMADIKKDGIIDSNDRTNIGSGIPEYTAGLNLQLGYKAFELVVDLYGSFGNEIYDGNSQSRYSGEDNFTKEWLSRWTGPGTSNRIPRVTFGGDWNYEISDRWVYDGSFIKLQNVRFQYTVPASIVDALPISMARLYISGNNLHYFTKYPGLSPEIPGSGLNAGVDRNVFPVSAFYQIGATIKF